ncbi:hypothetical protein ACFW15_11220, partial [Streptomyces sp. NPDC058953]
MTLDIPIAADGGVVNLVQNVDWVTIAPPVIAAVTGLLILVADLFVPEHRKNLLGLGAVAGLVAAVGGRGARGGRGRAGGGAAPTRPHPRGGGA